MKNTNYAKLRTQQYRTLQAIEFCPVYTVREVVGVFLVYFKHKFGTPAYRLTRIRAVSWLKHTKDTLAR